MTAGCPRLVIGGASSGVGKTSLTLGLARLLTRQGLRVQTFKVGPDFLDPTYLALASGRTCYNLDGWMSSRKYVLELFAAKTADADVALVEGVMGLFDGASPTSLDGSTAEVALWLDTPVLLVVGAHGAARSLAAIVKGFAEFEPGVRIAGVIANQGGSPRHRDWLAESLTGAGAAPLLGMLPRGALPALPSRHLGLVSAEQSGVTAALLDQLADACQQHLDVPRILDSARRSVVENATVDVPAPSAAMAAPPFSSEDRGEGAILAPRQAAAVRVRLGIARDAAFHFYYPDNLESLQAGGAELVPFSPLADPRLPAGLDAIYLGGGYPEAHAEQLSGNVGMLADIRDFTAAGGALYAECGGLMYLGRSLTTLDGQCWPLAGVLPLDTAMLRKLKILGYAEVAWNADSLWGLSRATCRGHEFHYSEIVAEDGPVGGWQPAYTVCRRRSQPEPAGLARGRVLAGYVHLHWAGRRPMIDHFLSYCESRI